MLPLEREKALASTTAASAQVTGIPTHRLAQSGVTIPLVHSWFVYLLVLLADFIAIAAFLLTLKWRMKCLSICDIFYIFSLDPEFAQPVFFPLWFFCFLVFLFFFLGSCLMWDIKRNNAPHHGIRKKKHQSNNCIIRNVHDSQKACKKKAWLSMWQQDWNVWDYIELFVSPTLF